MKAFYKLTTLLLLFIASLGNANATVLNYTATAESPACAGDTGRAYVSNIVATSTGPFEARWFTTAPIVQIATGDTVNLLGGNYFVRIFDSSDMSLSTPRFVTIVDPNPIVLVASQDPTTCFGGNDGRAILDVFGGTLPFSYVWDDPLTQNGTTLFSDTISGLTAGTYNVTVTDNNGCTSTDFTVVTEPTQVVPNVSTSNTLCVGSSDGSATASPTGGSGTYTAYNWDSNASTTATANGYAAGTYTVTVTDSEGCTNTETFTVGSPTPLGLSFNVTPILCFGDNTGSIITTPSGGNPGYTFNWFDGPTTQNRNNLVAGTYTLTLTDNNGCTFVDSAIVIQRPQLFLTVTTTLNNDCFGDANGSIDATVSGGTAGYSFLWSESTSGTGANSTISNLPAGTYTVTFTDAFGCTIVDSSTVTEPTQIQISVDNQTDPTCFGGNDGTITISSTGGTGAHTYVWSAPGNPTTPVIGGLSSGTYTVTVTDNNSCTATQTVTLSDPAPILPNVTTDSVTCRGGNDGSATATPTGGDNNYTYAWSVPGNTPTINSLSAGNYTVTVTDGNGCTGTETFQVGEPATAVSINFNITPNLCFGGTNGSIVTTVSGGIAPYTYAWFDSPTTQNRNNLAAGTYTLTVTDNIGCTKVDSAIVTERPDIVINLSKVDNVCGGGIIGSATANISGGTPGYSFVWSESTSGTGNSTTINTLPSGTYTITVTDAFGCTKEDSITILEPSDIDIVVDGITHPLCNGDANGAINLTVSGGTPAFTFDWNNSGTTEDISGLLAGTYTLTVTDGNGCTKTFDTTLVDPPVLNITFDSIRHISCNGQNDGFLRAAPTGGTGAYTYNWSNSASTRAINNLPQGTYTVTVTDANGCTDVDSATVNEPAVLGVNITSTDASCAGVNDGTATANVSGGTTPMTYLWAPDGQTTQTINGLSAGNYTVTVTDNNGCTAVDNVVITQPITLSVNITPSHLNCKSDNSGVALANVLGGTSPYTFLWSDPLAQTTNPATSLAAGPYTVTVTDNNGCSATASTTLTEPDTLIASITASTPPTCNGISDGTATVGETGGTGPYTYAWSTTPTQTTATANGLGSGTFVVTVTDNNGCTDTAQVTLTAPTAVVINVDSIANISCNGANDGYIELNPSGGNNPYTYTWNIGPNSRINSNLGQGTYNVTVTDNNGCTADTFFILTEPSLLTINLAATDADCFDVNDGTITTTVGGGTPAYTYSWSDINTSQNRTNLAGGTYTVTVTDNNGCTIVDSVTVNQGSEIIPNLTAYDVTCGLTNDGAAAVSPSGGTFPYTFNWGPGNPTGQGTDSISGLTAGTYFVTISDNLGCDTSLTFTINQGAATFTIADTVSNVSCNGANDGTIDLTLTGGVAPFTYTWNPVLPNSPNQAGLGQGTYDVTVADNTGCTLTDSYTITEPAVININETLTDESCFPGNDGAINLAVTGGTPPLTYTWIPALTNSPNQTGLTAGLYQVTVTDDNGCTDTASYTLNQLSNTFTLTLTPQDISCNGAADGQISVAVNPAGNYTFQWNGGLASNANPTVAAPGTYTVTVTDTITGCIAIDSATVNEPSIIQANLSVTSTGCSGTGNGNAKATPSGGNGGPYTFNWGPGAPAGQGTDSIFGLAAGNYFVTVTDNNGCSNVEAFNVSSNTSNISPNEVVVDASCFGDCDGSITLNPSNGVSPYFYNWADAAVTTPTRTALCAGTYTVTITGSDNCDTVLSVVVGQPDSIFATLRITPDTCVSSAGGVRALSVTNGTAPYTFRWGPPGVKVGNDSVRNLLAGNYNVTITDANGCSQIQPYTITNFASFTVDLDSTTHISCFGANDGSIFVNVIGGTSPLTYNWTGGLTGANPQNLSPGTYTITVTDANGCGAIQTTTVNTPDDLLITQIDPVGESCQPGNDGTATAAVTGGTQPYTYSWPPPGSGTGNVGSGYTTNNGYLLTVTDANGCSIVEVFDIGSVATFTVNSVVTDATCSAADGAIAVTVVGATNPLTFRWGDIGIGTANRTNLIAGTYVLTVTDGTTCSETAIFDVKASDAVQIDNILTTDESCNPGMDGTATSVVSGGTAPFTYTWSGTTATTPGVTGLAAGVYILTVTDANTCTAVASFQIDAGSDIDPNDTITDVSCSGGTDGVISLSPSGGLAPYTYDWSPISASTATVTGLQAGGYLVTITDNTGCSTVESYIVTQPLRLVCSFNAAVESCVPGGDGSVTAVPNRGTPPYTYDWGFGNTNVDTQTGLSAGNYNMTVTDANGCTRAFAYTIAPAPPINVTATSITPATCGNNDGAITLNTTGGSNPVTYDWSDVSIGGANPTSVAAGTYTVTATDGNGCTDVETVTVTTNGSFPINETVVNPTCNGDCDGSITLSPSGGVSPYTYLWGDNSTNFFRTGLCDGTYEVTVTDNTGCSTSQSINVTEPLPIAANISGVDESCIPGGDGSASTAATGGTGAYTYLWSSGGATTAGITGLSSGRFTVTITDANACSVVDSVDISSGGNLVLNEVLVDPTCNGDCDGSITLNPTGGNAPYTYLWGNSSSGSSRTALCDGTYDVTVTDNSACSTTASFTLTEPDPLAGNITKVDASCFPGMDGSATSGPTGGTSPYTFLWSAGGATTTGINGLSPGTYTLTLTDNSGCSVVETTTINSGGNINQNGVVADATCFGACDGSITLSPSGGFDPNYFYQWDDNSTFFFRAGLCAGTYTATVTNGFGCSKVETYTVGEPDSLQARINSTDETCSPGGDGTATTSATGGSSPYTYLWNPGGATTAGINSISSGTYRVTVTDRNGCSVVDSTIVNSGGNLALNETVNDASCNGGCDGSISLNPSGGNSPYTYLWDNNSSNSSRSNLCAGNYDVTVSDNTGCSTTTSFTINEPALLEANTSATAESCSPGSDGSASTAASGGTAPYTYLWSPGGATTPGISSLTAGTYRVTVTDRNGCTVLDSSIVGSGANISLNEIVDDARCNGDCNGIVRLFPSGGVSPYTYLWEDNSTFRNRFNVCAGTYEVTVTDNTGCSTTASFTVNEPSLIAANTSSTNANCSPGSNGTASTAAAGGTPPYTYLWSPGAATTPSISSLVPGTYRVTITDDNGCTVVDSSIVGSGGNISLGGTFNDASCNGVCDGDFNIIPAGGTSPYTFIWDDNSTNPIRTGLCAGNYTITVTDNTGCSRIETFNLLEPDPLLANGSSTDESCSPGGDGTASTAATGGTPPYTYNWTPGGAITPGLSSLSAGDYTVTLTDQNGCSVVETINVGSDAPFTVNETLTDASCNGAADGGISLSVTGAIGTLTYSWLDIGIAGPVRTGLLAGTYSVTITDGGNSCVDTESYTINEPAAINISSAVTDASCVPGNDGAIDLTVSGGSTPYTYLWDKLPPIEDHTNIAGDVYNVTVTDNNGCSNTDIIAVGGGAPFTVNISATDANCNGSDDGTASVSVVGATNPLTFQWSGGLSGQNPTSIPVGNYTLTVTDASGCTEVNSIVIGEPALITGNTGSISTTACGVCDGKAFVFGLNGGTGTINLNWLDNTKSPISQTSDTARNLCPGVYYVALEDQNNCVDTLSVSVSDGPALPVTVSSTDEQCAGACDGTASVSSPCISSLDCTVEWRDASNALIATTPSISNLCPGDYFVEVTDINNGCIVTDVVTILPATPLVPNLTTADDGCGVGSVCQGYAKAEPTGGTAPYSFDWSGPSTNVSGVDSIGSLCAGNYSVTITDANGCDTVLGFTIAPQSTFITNATSTNETCTGLCDGTASVDPTGGQAPYTYSWSNSAGNVKDLTGLCSGTYTVTITDAVQCDTTVTFNIGTASLSYTLSSTDQSCNGGCDGTAEVQIPGGTSGYSFNWSPAPGAGQGTAQVTGLCVGDYFVTITLNSTGCTAVDNITIDPSTPILPNEASSDESCVGACDGIARVSPTGGVGNYTYLWTPTPPNSQQGNAEIRDLCAGTYTVQIFDAAGCDTSVSFNISPANAIVSNIVGEDQLCGNSNPCEGRAFVSPTGGTAPYTYQWSLGVITSSPDTAIELCNGKYFVTITDANSCTVLDSITIGGPAPIDTAFTVVNSTCNICDGSITVVPSGGTAPYTYSWTDASNANIGTTDNVSNLCSGIYFVEISDALGCSATFARTMSDNGAEAVNMTKTDVSCFGGSDGTATANFICSDIPCTVEWFDALAQPLGITTATASNLSAGLYFVRVNNNSGCRAFESISIDEPDQFFVNANITETTCNSSCDGAISINLIGGNAPYTFNWSPSPASGQGTATINGLCAVDYTVTISDNNGCDTIITYTVGSPDPLTASFTSVDASCNQADGFISATVSGGTIALDYQYQWFDGANNLLAGQVSSTISNIAAGTYFLRVTDDNNCVQRFTTVLGSSNSPTITVDSVIDASCFGGNDGAVFISASGANSPFTYNWLSLGQTSEDVSNLTAGTYTVQVRNTSGCVATEVVQVNEPTQLIASFTTQNADCGQCNGLADVTVSGGTAPYTYLWSNGSTVDTANGLCGGAHNLVVADANGCSQTFNFTINTTGGPTNAIVSATAESCAGAKDGSATVTPVGGTAPYTYLWIHNGATSNSLNNLSAGSYFILITDAAGCSRNVEVIITAPTELVVQETVDPSSCGTNCDGSIGLNVNGGLGPYTFSWAIVPTADTNFLGDLCAGIYNVTVTDASGCSKAKTIILPNLGNPTTSNPTADNVSCFGSCDGSLLSNLTASANLTFQWLNNDGAAIAPPDQDLNNAACAGDYILEVTTLPSGCKSYATVTVSEPDSIELAASIVKNISCFGDCDGEIFISTLGGSILYQYSWDNGTDGVPITDLCAGTYGVTATDANGCTAEVSVTLNNPPELLISLNSSTVVNCSSDCDAEADVSATGGTAPYTFNWDGGQTGTNPTDLCFGPNVVTVTDATGCSRDLTVNIGAIDTVVAQVPTNTLICAGDSIYLDGTILGSTVTSFGWYLADTTTLFTGSEDTTILRGIGTHTFFLIATNGTCDDTTEYTVEVVPTPIVTISSPISLYRDEVEAIEVSGENATYLYNWTPSLNITDTTIAEPIVSPRENRTYVLTVTDTNGCQYIDSVLVIYSPNLGIPSGITPNGDGKNDVWNLDALEEFPDATVQVFNRWGELMYEQRNGYKVPWDGTYKGEPLPVGTYYFVIDLKSDRFEPITGPITIVK